MIKWMRILLWIEGNYFVSSNNALFNILHDFVYCSTYLVSREILERERFLTYAVKTKVMRD